MNGVYDTLRALEPQAVAANRAVFSDANNLENIARYVTTGRFPWA